MFVHKSRTSDSKTQATLHGLLLVLCFCQSERVQPESAPGVKLKELLDENGQLVYDPDKTFQLLSAASPSYFQEIQVLIAAQRSSLPWELLNLGPSPAPEKINDIATMLQTQTGMPPEAAHWALQTWAYALDIDLGHIAEAPDSAEPQSDEHQADASESAKPPEVTRASPTAKYFVVDGPNRWGPGSIETLNEWGRQGRLHGRMLFEDQETGHRFTANEIPGLFIPTVGFEQVSGAYFRPPTYMTEPAQVKRKADMAIVKSILVAICCSIIGGGIALVVAICAKVALSKGNVQSAMKLARAADIISYVSIPIGLVSTIFEVMYFMNQYHGAFGMLMR